ncbi:MAG TPA: bifunctional [glutamine synthetase] adenylyltransferase/[glutamine synthetase]-adenylyl-L-tyrosine phosphorylase [Streptosporangiaceae bacterium]|nr:bifunctional [glutamine synthetase] adenylyltransferase/[glutamine synthetase]-adenylyl-L-tyrosine phosphorylase [Streptosporangiaceae bacterium]
MPRRTTAAARLARLGFADPARAELLLTGDLAADVSQAGDGLVDALATAADPDLALAALARMPRDAELIRALGDDPRLRARLAAVLGASAALGDHLARHPGHWEVLAGEDDLPAPGPEQVRAELLAAVGARAEDPEPAAGQAGTGQPGTDQPGSDPVAALRVAYRRRLLPLAARDLTGEAPFDQVAAELADLAAAALEAALAIARAKLPPGSAPCRLAVIAMGKCGARELNYASDVDVIFVAEPAGTGEDGEEATALRTATQLAAGLIQVCSQSTPEGALFPVDPNLRPEGRNGPLVRTLASHRAYYQRWAQTWEFQALLKARPVAGDAALGAAYAAEMSPLVWQAAERENFVSDVQAMRRRVIGTLPAAAAGREIKLGPGGLRDIEFAVQLLQLVHGRVDESLREPATLPALAMLAAGGYVGRQDAAELARAYRFLRRVEHLLQLRHLRRTHTMPEEPEVLRRIGRALRLAGAGQAAQSGDATAAGTATEAQAGGSRPLATDGRLHAADGRPPPTDGRPRVPGAAGRLDPAEELLARWREHATQVQRLHEKLFYRPLLDAVASLPGEVARLTPQAAEARLKALGYADPAGALRHIGALTAGVSRRAAIQRTLLPLLLGWFADAADPDAGLLAFHQVSDALGNSPWYLRLLRDDMTVAQRMARLLASSRYAAGLLLRQPETVAWLGNDAQLAARDPAALHAEAAALVGRHGEAAAAVAALRALRCRELLRTAMADLLGRSGPEQTGEALTAVAAVTIEAALQVAVRSVADRRGEFPTRLCVVAMGRFGGHESGYGSDADVMFVHDPLPGADEQEATAAAHAAAEELRALLGRPGPEPPLLIDPGLRPEGRQGPLVRTLASYRAYYQRWSVPWESQALLRAEPVAGDSELGARFTVLADEFRYPDGGIPEPSVLEIRRLKARMEAERMPRGVNPALHLKLGPGGLSDVEWVVQLLQLRHAHAVPELRTTRTLAGLDAAARAGLVTQEDADVLARAWRLASRIRDAVVLVRGRAADVLPARASELAAVASVLGYQAGTAQDLVQDYRQAARRARGVMEALFYG